jgi:polyisoprenoid-binding protein YceI
VKTSPIPAPIPKYPPPEVRKRNKPNHALILALLAAPAYAGNWLVDPATSSLSFAGTQAGEPFNGSFKRFIAEINFHEATPETSTIQITIDMKSVSIDGPDRADALPTKDWFDIPEFPNAEFTSTKIVKTAEHQFAATGNLTIRGVRKQVTLPFTLKPESKTGVVAQGSITLDRSNFNIGQGRWTDDKWIAFPVTVNYVIHATGS